MDTPEIYQISFFFTSLPLTGLHFDIEFEADENTEAIVEHKATSNNIYPKNMIT
jgi:hypothetical protein